jgi:hypothetical protein
MNPRNLSQPQNTSTTQIGNLKKVVLVYQLQYKNGGIYGFGDFIRGCFALLGICNQLGLEFDFDLSNHPMSKYVEGHVKNPNLHYADIQKMTARYNPTEFMWKSPERFYETFKRFAKTTKDEVFYTCSNSFPVFNIQRVDIERIKSRLIPTIQMQNDLEQEIASLGLKKGEFSVIHIRAGDDLLLNRPDCPQDKINKLFDQLRETLAPLLNKDHKYLILSDSTGLKKEFIPYTNCVFQQKKITHLGQQPTLDEDAVRNTMMDFYLMSQSSHIYSYSVYIHGSGFSKWCAVLYNIPYDTYSV